MKKVSQTKQFFRDIQSHAETGEEFGKTTGGCKASI